MAWSNDLVAIAIVIVIVSRDSDSDSESESGSDSEFCLWKRSQSQIFQTKILSCTWLNS